MAGSDSVSYSKIKRRKKMAASDKVFYFFLYAFFVLFAAVMLYPFIRMMAYSFNKLDFQSKSYAYSYYDSKEAVSDGIWFLPRKWTLENYKRLIVPEWWSWEHGIEIHVYYDFYRPIAVTAGRTVIGTFTGLTANALLAFILSRKKFLFRSGLSLFWIIAAFLQGGFFTLIPTYILYRYMHLNESFWVYIIPGMVSVFYVMIIRTYMRNIPPSLEETAQLEGAGYMRIFWTVISPVCKPVYAATAFFIAVYHWNSWFDTLLYNRFESRYRTLMFTLMCFYNEIPLPEGVVASRAPTPSTIKAAATIIAITPVIIAYPFFQKYFVTGLTISGVKE